MLRRGARELARAIAGVVDARVATASHAGARELPRLHAWSRIARAGVQSSSAGAPSSSSSSASPREDVWRAWKGYGDGGERGRRDDGTLLRPRHRRLRRTHTPRDSWTPEQRFNDAIIKISKTNGDDPDALLSLVGGSHVDAWDLFEFHDAEADGEGGEHQHRAMEMPVKREWRPVNVATAANRLWMTVDKGSTHATKMNKAVAVLSDDRYATLVGMIATTVDEFGPVETATTLKSLATAQMYADNARVHSPHSSLGKPRFVKSKKSRNKTKSDAKADDDDAKTSSDEHSSNSNPFNDAASVGDLATGLARAVSRNARRMHKRQLALTIPALRRLPSVVQLIDEETVAALVVGVEESAMHDALSPVEAANVIHAVTRISPLLHAAMGKQSVVDATVRCLVDKSQTMDRRCVALSLDAATRLRLSDGQKGALASAFGAATARVVGEVTEWRRLGKETEWSRMGAGMRRLGLTPPAEWSDWSARRSGKTRGTSEGE